MRTRKMSKKYIFLTACLTLLLCFNNVAYAEAESSEVRTLWLNKDAKGAIAKTGSAQVPGKPQVLRKSEKEVLFNSSATYATAASCEMEGKSYDILRLPGGSHGGEVGKPELPYYGQFIAVPKNADVKLIIDTVKIIPIEGEYRVTPVQPPLPDTADAEIPPFAIDGRLYAQNKYLGEDNVVRIADDVIIRGKRLLYVIYQPVLYNPRESKLKAVQDVTWHLEYTYTQTTSPTKIWEKELNNSVGNMVIDAVPGEKIQAKQAGQGLSLDTDGADYLIITHDDFYDEILPLAEWKKKKGYQARVTKLSEIGANPTSDDIRAYIVDAYDTWNPQPLYLLLVGDSGFLAPCYKDNQGNSISSASDLYYGAVDGIDMFPDIFVGRLPAATTQECENMVNKILLMENNPPALESYYNTALLAGYFQDISSGDPQDGYEGRLFLETSEGVKDFLEHEGWIVETSYITQSSITPRHYNRTSNGSILHDNGTTYVGTQVYLSGTAATSTVTNAINDGVWLVQHRDHGGETFWGEPYYTISHIQSLNNNGMPTFLNSTNCLTGTYDRSSGDCFAEAFLKKENSGAYAVTAASRISYSWWNDYLVHGFYECMFPDYFETLSTFTGYRTNLSYSGNYVGNGTHFGQILNFGKIFMYDKRGSGSTTKIEFEMFHLFGCPEQEPRMVLPQTLTVSHPANLPANQGASFDVTVEVGGLPLENARVSLISDLEFYAGVTDDQGVVHFSFTPEDTDGIDITVTHRDARPYEGQIQILSTPRTLTVINGTGDGTYYFGEVVDILANPPSPNYRFDEWAGNTAGIADVEDPSTTLTMPDSDVTITAQYRLGTYALNAVAGPGGSGVAKVPDNPGYAYGEVVELTAEVLPTYHFTHWTGEFPAGHQLDNPLDITIEEDIDITANFSRDTYIIVANAHNICGVINPSGEVQVAHGVDQTFTMTPNAGCHVTDVVVDTVSQGPITTHTFPNVTSNHTIDAYFDVDTYDLTVNSGTGTGTYIYSARVHIEAYPPQVGYHFTHWSGDIANVADPNASPTTITMLSNAAVTANYAINTYIINASAEEGGLINPSGNVAVNHGEDKAFLIQAPGEYTIRDVLVDGQSRPVTDGAYRFENVTSNHTIVARFNSTSIPMLVLHSYNVIDDWMLDSFKVNGDGLLNPGEQRVEISVELKNTGGESATEISAVLFTSDPDITILQDTVGICQTLEPGQTCSSTDNFVIEAADTILDDTGKIDFTLTITSQENEWIEDFKITVAPPLSGPLSADIRLDTGDTAGATYSRYVKICSDDNGNVYAVWEDRRSGYYDVYFNYSHDYGLTWEEEDIKINTNPVDNSHSFVPQINCDNNGNIYVVWENYNSATVYDIYFNASHDYGKTWAEEHARLNTNPIGTTNSRAPQISSDENGHVYVTWYDGRSERDRVYFNYSADYGDTWQVSDIRVDRNPIVGRTATNPVISSDETGNVYIAWIDLRNVGWDIYFNSSHDYGATWQAEDVRLDTSDEHSLYLTMNSDNTGHVYVAWSDIRDAEHDVYINYSHDHGATWQANDIRLNTNQAGAFDSWRPQVGVNDNGGVYVIWHDQRDVKDDIYLNYSLDFGVNWQANDTKINNEPAGSADSLASVISCDNNGNTYVAWYDYRNGTRDVYFNYSFDDGATWQPDDMRLNTNTAGTSTSRYPAISSDNKANVYVAWEDDRNGTYDIYFTSIVIPEEIPQLDSIDDETVSVEELLEFDVTASDGKNSPLTLFYDPRELSPQEQINISNATLQPAGVNVSAFNWIPAPGTSGTYEPIYFVAKNTATGRCAYQDMSILVLENLNNAPKLLPIGNKEGTEDQDFIIKTMRATDVDGDTLTIDATNLPSGARFFQAGSGEIAPGHTFVDYKLRWPAKFVKEGVYTVTFTASDEILTDSETITITIHDAGNRAPVLRNIGDREGPEKEWFAITKIIATDPDGDDLTMQIANRPSGAKFILVESRPGYVEYKLKWAPRFVKQGVYENVTFTVSDGALTDAEAITITITDTGNLDPALRPIGDREGREGEWFAITKIIATDDDSDNLTMTVENLPPGSRFIKVEDRPGYIEYKLKWSPENVTAGTYENVTFTVRDGVGGEDSESIRIDIGGAPPVINTIGGRPAENGRILDFSVNEGESLTFTITASDPTQDPISYHVYIAGDFNHDGKCLQAFDLPIFELTYQLSKGDEGYNPEADLDNNDQISLGDLSYFAFSLGKRLPEGISIDSETGSFNWTTTSSDGGQYFITLVADDGFSVDAETILVNVQ